MKCQLSGCNNQTKGLKFKYCSVECRNKRSYQEYKGKQKEWRRNRDGRFAEGKIECKICGKWYVQVCSHVYLMHGLNNREYKKYCGKDIKKGLIPDWYKEIKRETQDINTIENLKLGEKYRFKPGDERAGRYKRSEETLERLKFKHILNKEK